MHSRDFTVDTGREGSTVDIGSWQSVAYVSSGEASPVHDDSRESRSVLRGTAGTVFSWAQAWAA